MQVNAELSNKYDNQASQMNDIKLKSYSLTEENKVQQEKLENLERLPIILTILSPFLTTISISYLDLDLIKQMISILIRYNYSAYNFIFILGK